MSDVAVIQLVTFKDGKADGECTAFKVDERHVMTAGHCCETEEGHTFSYSGKGPHAVPGASLKVVFDNDDHDVCVLRGPVVGAPLWLADQDPAIGDRVWTAGWPRNHFLISDGHWSGRRGTGKDERGVTSTVGWYGASGSPVMDRRGRVVGVLIEIMRGQDNITRVAPLEWLRSALEHARAQK